MTNEDISKCNAIRGFVRQSVLPSVSLSVRPSVMRLSKNANLSKFKYVQVISRKLVAFGNYQNGNKA